MHTETTAHIERATSHLRDTVRDALEHASPAKALVIYDTHFPLTTILTEAYRNVLPDAQFLDIDTTDKEGVLRACEALSPRDLVILVQSTDFRLNEFRIRIYLFQQKLKVIDHRHLSRHPEHTWSTYIDALAYDIDWYRGTGNKLKTLLEAANTLRFKAKDATLTVTGGVEVPKLNVGDYTGMENIGGTFPIGEVFTEAKDLGAMNGSLYIYAFAGTDYNLLTFEPFRIDIKDGLLVGWSDDAPPEFAHVVELVRSYERSIMREIGFGLNRAITRDTPLYDITAFERIHGIHFSLGEKHTVYKKEGIKSDKSRFHVDMFPVIEHVYTDDTLIFDGTTYTV